MSNDRFTDDWRKDVMSMARGTMRMLEQADTESAAESHPDRAADILELQRLRFNAEDLKSMELELLLKSKNEPDSSRQMALDLARLEIFRLMETYSQAALRLSLEASLEMEDK